MALIVPMNPASQVQPQDPSDSDDPPEDPSDPAAEPSEEPSALTPAEHATLVPVEFDGQLTAIGTAVTYAVPPFVVGLKSAPWYPAERLQSPVTTSVPVDPVGQAAAAHAPE